MRVLQICPYDIGRPGGVQRHIVDLSNTLARAGHEVTIVAPTGGDAPPLHPRVELQCLGRPRELRMHGTRFEATWASRGELDRLESSARANPFDAAHFHTIWTPFMPWQVWRRIRGLVARNVATFHDTPPPGISGALTRSLFRVLSRRLSKRLDAMIAVSTAPAQHLRVVDGSRLVVLPGCIDLHPYAALARSRNPIPGYTILFVGRLEPRKGILILIEAFARVKGDEPRARLVVCGDGDQRADAEALAERLGVADAVTFAGGLSDAERLTLYGHADAFCSPAPYGESYGLVLAEAMAAGVPVVAAANPGYRTVLTGAGAAGLVKPGDAAELATRLAQVLASFELRESLTRWGNESAWRSDVSARLPEFLALYAPAAEAPARTDLPVDTSARAYAARN
jgi:phosphatidylinositol alpha-mannosyltransferase